MRDSSPRVIHYCWFGGSDLTDRAKTSLESWEKFAPDFAILRWDESNFDIDCSAWTRDAYDAGKYAFVADYARFKILYEQGGVYMDVGSELVKDITDLVFGKTPFSAIEELSITATTGLIVAVEPRNSVIGSVLQVYDNLVFENNPDFLATHTVNTIFTNELEKIGFVKKNRYQEFENWTVLPSHCFDPVYGLGGYHIKKDTYAVHKSSASWLEPKFKTQKEIQDRLAPFVGRRVSQIMGRIVGELKHEGIRVGLKNLGEVARSCIKRGGTR